MYLVLNILLDNQAVLKFLTVLNNAEMNIFMKMVFFIFGNNFHRKWPSKKKNLSIFIILKAYQIFKGPCQFTWPAAMYNVQLILQPHLKLALSVFFIFF